MLHEELQRQALMSVGGRLLRLPCFFPSVSSVKANHTPIEYLRVLSVLEYPQFLVSAWDLHRMEAHDAAEARQLALRAKASGSIVLLDSGGYESFWQHDRSWSERHVNEVIQDFPCDLAFACDGGYPEGDPGGVAGTIVERTYEAQGVSQYATVCPILHGDPTTLPALSTLVAERVNPLLIAVPERELGEGLVARARSVMSIRAALNATGRYYPLHLLGTGNPLSMVVYALSGADSFDGLEWCQVVADPESGRLSHLHHWELFRGPEMQPPNLQDYPVGVLVHNLHFYLQWGEVMATVVQAGTLRALPARFVHGPLFQIVESRLPEVLG